VIISSPCWRAKNLSANTFFAYDKLGGIAIIASAAGFIRNVLQIFLPERDTEGFPYTTKLNTGILVVIRIARAFVSKSKNLI
jgi:hypothetical protein